MLIPAQALDVEEHGTAGVGIVGDVDPAAGELPDKPGVHRSKEQLPPTGPLPCPLHVVQDPLQFGGGKIGIRQQAGVFPDVGGELVIRLQLLAQGRGAAALPDDGVVHRPACLPVPNDGGLPLVGDPDSRHLGGVHPALGQHLGEDTVLAGIDLHGIMLHPAGLWVVLSKFPLGQADNILLPVEQDASAAGGALIQGENIGAVRHNNTAFPGEWWWFASIMSEMF